jgi:hypothetical protein
MHVPAIFLANNSDQPTFRTLRIDSIFGLGDRVKQSPAAEPVSNSGSVAGQLDHFAVPAGCQGI